MDAPTIDEASAAAVSLGIQLAVAAGLVLLMVVLHSVWLVVVSRVLHLNSKRLKKETVNPSSILMIGTLGLMIFIIHIVEIFIFAGFYIAIGAISSVEEALYYSASCYATLGDAAAHFSDEWRLVGALEALIGFVLIGWSTAFMVRTLRKIID